MKTAIITGASSGIGRHFVKEVLKYHCLDEIWIIARRTDRLLELKTLDPLRIRVISMDLTKSENFNKFNKLLKKKNPNVKLLVNCAGIGKIGYFADYTPTDISKIIKLNCLALTLMTHSLLPFMTCGSRIIQVSSSSAFMPLPALSVYSASKAFVLNYALALRNELKNSHINVTAVCPYWVSDSEFILKAKETKSGYAISSFPLSTKAGDVVFQALKDSKNNKAISTCGIVSSFIFFTSKLIPNAISIYLWNIIRKL